MSPAVGFGLFWAVSFFGYELFKRFKVPAPAILGPVACFIALTMCNVNLAAPSWQKPCLSVITGILLGLRFNHKSGGALRQMALAAAWMIGLSLTAAGALTLAGVSRETALFAATPGGIAEITLMSLDYHSDPFAAVLLQSSRMICSMVAFSTLAAKYSCSENKKKEWAGKTGEQEAGGKRHSLQAIWWAFILPAALAAAWLLGILRVPAASLLGPMLVTGLFVKAKDITYKIDRRLQIFVQIGIGGLAGASIARESVLGFWQYLIPALLLNLIVIGGSLALAGLMMKLTDWDKATCILSCCPAGLSPTIMVAMEYGADSNIVTLFQVLRMVTVLIFTPTAARLLL